jgi:hypothetical protein
MIRQGGRGDERTDFLVAACFSCGHPSFGSHNSSPCIRTITMPKRTAIANGANPVEQQAAQDANEIQDACNSIAIVGCWHRHLVAMSRAGIGGDNLINHPTSLAFLSKLNSLCRMTCEREMAAFDAIDKLQHGESAEYEVIPL